MRKLTCTFLIITIIVGGLVFLGFGNAATYVNSPITSNTMWAYVNSPYTLTGNIIVNYGATLTIEPGVTVDFGPYQLQVNGGLNARGTSSSKIVFSSAYSSQKIEFTSSSAAWNEAFSSGCIIDNAIISSVPIVVSGASPKISNAYFNFNTAANVPITVNGGSPSIAGNVINFPSSTDGIHVNSGSPTISSNSIRGQGQWYGIYTAGNAYISNNNITNCYSGIWANGQSTIVQNNIMNNVHDGIRTDNSATSIQNNAIANNLCGVSGTGRIQFNTITANTQAGIWGPLPTTTILSNSIYGNPQNVHLTELANITATNNWWGTTDQDSINQTIWDYKNDPVNLGTLTFVPFLDTPPSTPSIPTVIPTPTQPPTPPPYTPTVQPTSTATSTPTSTLIPTSTAYQTENPAPTPPLGPTPTQTAITPIETPNSTLITLSYSDLVSVIVILSAVITIIVIIMLLNRRFTKKH